MRIRASRLLEYTTDELLEMLNGKFTLLFDDGTTLDTQCDETIYSRYVWELIHEFPDTKLRPEHHITRVLNGAGLSAGAHTTLLSNVFWDVYFTYINHPQFPEDPVYLREYLAKRIYEITNKIYNELSIEWMAYVMTLEIEDMIEVRQYPEIKEILSRPSPSERYIQSVYDLGKDILVNRPNEAKRTGDFSKAIAYNNRLSRFLRSKLVNQDQSDQCVFTRGHVSDINSDQFKVPISTSLVEGKQSLYAATIESRSASKALFATKSPLQRSETYNRFSQMLAQVVRYMSFTEDCGSTDYILWKLRDGDLRHMIGVNYLDEETGTIKWLGKHDTHLIGKLLKLRLAQSCNTQIPGGVCAVCFGQLSHHVFRQTNIGHACTTEANGKYSQGVMSTKHLDKSIVIAPVRITGDGAKYFQVIGPDLIRVVNPDPGRSLTLVIAAEDAPGFPDIWEVDDVRDLSISRTTAIKDIGIDIRLKDLRYEPSATIGEDKRRASLTHELLEYIKHKGFTYDIKGRYLVDLSDWDFEKDAFAVPRRHVSMGDHVNEIARRMEGRNGEENRRNNDISISAYLQELFDLTNEKLSINLQVIAVTVLANMVINSDPYDEDFSTPKGYTRQALGIYSTTIRKRSLGSTMAHQNQANVLLDPANFIQTNRMSSPLDVCLDPASVMSRPNDTVPYYT